MRAAGVEIDGYSFSCSCWARHFAFKGDIALGLSNMTWSSTSSTMETITDDGEGETYP